MHDQVDFESYAAARWHLVVRTLVLLGSPPGHAATLAREALAERRSEWSHQDAFDDLDAELYRAVLDLRHRDRAAWWAEPPFDDELWTEVEPELDRLTRLQREWLVLRHVAELPESYVEAVVGETAPTVPVGAPTGQRLRDVARAVPVQPPDLEQVDEMASALRRHRRRRAGLGVVGLVGLVGVVALGVVLGAGDDPDPAAGGELEPVTVERTSTGSAVGWYADGRLHLSHVVLDVPDVRAVATVNDGAVYADDDGDLVQVNDQGQRTLLATIGEQGTFASSDEEGLVAWLSDAEDATLVVRDLTARSDVVTVEVDGTGRVIAVDGGSVFFRDDRGDVELTVETGEVEPLGTSSLLDVSSKVKVFQETPDSIRAEQPLFDIRFGWEGEGAELSEDGNFVLTWVGENLAIYDTRSGEEVPADLAPGSLVLDAEFGPDETITFLALQFRSSSGLVDVRTCSLGLVFLPSGERAPECTQEEAGAYAGAETDLLLAR
ncbi:MAG: hypothetical protein M3237_12600 [Actinomycetota bacterium]|nr:hypothetical protein [Actinomycetota bacterium]